MRPEHAAASMLPMKNHENLLLVSSLLYQRVIVKRAAGMNPASQRLHVRFISSLQMILLDEAIQAYPRSIRVTMYAPSPF